MAEQARDPASLGDGDSSLRSDAPTRRLCIVSSKPFLCSPFMAALRTALTQDDALEIVVDRRREPVPTEARPGGAEQLSVDRRRHRQVDRNLKFDGFAIVPATATGLRARRSLMALPLTEAPVEEAWPEDLEDGNRRESVRHFVRARTGRLITWPVILGFMSAVVISFALSSSVTILGSRPRQLVSSSERLPVSLHQDKETPADAPALSRPAEPAEFQRTELPEASSPVRGEHSPSGGAREFPAGEASEMSAEARIMLNPRATASPRPITNVTTGPIVNNPALDAAAARITTPRFPGLPRVEVIGTKTIAPGQTETYAVRISDPAGRPLAGADVSLHARMADGTVQRIWLHSGPEPGTYQATVPGGSSAPVDVRLAITASDKRVEIPLSP